MIVSWELQLTVIVTGLLAGAAAADAAHLLLPRAE